MRAVLFSLLLAAIACAPEYQIGNKPPEPEPPVDTAPEPEPEIPAEPGVAPVAVCSATPNPVRPPFETATWLGRDSYSPSGKAITRAQWRLTSKPVGSAAVMPGGDTINRQGFVPDLAGVYKAELRVYDADGLVSEVCETELEAVPSQSLWVELFWTHDNDDLDLHLVRDGGRKETQDDCYYSNCVRGGPDWGVRGEQADNPRLDLDDRPNVGPENINIDAPGDPGFTVYVHDYPGHTYQGANEATVNIYLDGQLVWTDTRTISGESSWTEYAHIDWAARSVQSR
jgi:hypothetical protein